MAIYHGHTVIFSTFLCRFVGIGIYSTGGLFITSFTVTFNIGTGLAAFNIAILGAVSFASSLLSGYLNDLLLSKGYTSRPVYAVGSLLVFAGTFGASYCKSFVILLLCAIFTGTGVGFTCFSSGGLLSLWFVKNKGRNLLLAMCGGGTGNFLYARAIVAMFDSFHDSDDPCKIGIDNSIACIEWRPTLRYMGLFSSTVLLFASIFMRAPHPGEVERFENLSVENKSSINITTENKYATLAGLDNFELSNTGLIHFELDKKAERWCRPSIVFRNRLRNKPNALPAISNISLSSSLAQPVGSFAASDCLDQDKPEVSEGLDDNLSSLDNPLNVLDQKSEIEQVVRSRADMMQECRWLSFSGSIRGIDITQVTSLIDGKGEKKKLSFKQLIRTRTFILLCIWAFSMAFVFDAYYIFAPVYAEEIGLSKEDGALIISVTGLSSLVGNLTIGFITDRLGNIKPFQFCMMGMMFSMIVWPFCTSLWSLLAIGSILGFSAVSISLFVSIMSDVYSEMSKECFFSLIGLIQALETPGVLLGPVAIGILIEHYNFYVSSFFCAFGFSISVIATLLLPSKESQFDLISTVFSVDKGEENLPLSTSDGHITKSSSGKETYQVLT